MGCEMSDKYIEFKEKESKAKFNRNPTTIFMIFVFIAFIVLFFLSIMGIRIVEIRVFGVLIDSMFIWDIFIYGFVPTFIIVFLIITVSLVWIKIEGWIFT